MSGSDLRRIDVTALVAELGVVAKRKGKELEAPCPLPDHADRKPSWSIRDQIDHPRHGRHHCFSCGQGGGPVSLVCDVLGIPWDEAKQWIIERGLAGDLPDLAPAVEIAVFGEAPAPFAMPRECTFRPLEKWVTPARRYALARGITPGQVERWQLGYAVDGRLAGRIVLPIFDELGRLASYTGRAYDGAEPRYKHPHRSEGPNESAVFGSHLWGDERARLVLNEGELNALACERVGERCVAALSGAARVTPDAIALLSTFDRVIVLTDPDAAGDTAAMRVIAALARWRDVVRIRLPEGTDAAKLGPTMLRKILEAA